MADRNIPFCDEPKCNQPADERFVGLTSKKPLDLCKKHMRRYRLLASATQARKAQSNGQKRSKEFACTHKGCDFMGMNEQSLRFHRVRKHGYRAPKTPAKKAA